MIWLSIDVEEVTDMNFNVLWKNKPVLDYEKLIDHFIELQSHYKKTAFVLGSFAKKYPHIVKKISDNGIEIASHGFFHKLVYKESFEEWSEELKDAKALLEDLTGKKVKGYRSPSWSMPFEKKYYSELARLGFSYSSSYFPMKNYMYGNSINKTKPFYIYTEHGKVQERPIPKYIIPFSGGFYLRVLPLWLLKILFSKSNRSVIYIHPYELINANLLSYFNNYADKNIDYFLAFFSLGFARDKLRSIVEK